METRYRVMHGIQVIALCDSRDEAEDWLERFPDTSLERVTDNFSPSHEDMQNMEARERNKAKNGY